MANEFIEVLSESAIKDVKTLNREITKTVTGINKANEAAKGLKIPSEFRAALNDLNSIIRQSNTLLRAQIQLQQQLAGATATNTNTTINAERVERERLRTEQQRIRTEQQQLSLSRQVEESERRRQAATDRLGSAYLQLSKQQAAAARRVQDLIVAGRQATQTQREYDRELRTAQREFNTLNQRVLLADRAVGRFNRNVGNYPKAAFMGLKDLLGAFGIVGGVTAFAAITKDIFQTTKELQSLNLALTQVTGSQELAAESMRFLTGISDSYGIEIKGLTRSYTQFYAAAADKLSGSEIRNIFDSISKSAGAMGLSVEQQQGAFLALQQMISKGKVSAEELNQQLAERLPGAFGILAKSMGVTEIQLNKLLKDGKVMAAEVLPAFAREFEKAYGVENLNRVESLTAETTRLSNAWTALIQSISNGDGAFSKFLTGSIGVLKDVIIGFDRLVSSKEELQKKFENNVEEEAYKEQLRFLNEEIKTLDKRKESAQLILQYNPQDLATYKQQREELYKEETRLQEKLSHEGPLGFLSPFKRDLDIVQKKIDVLFSMSAARRGEMQAANEILDEKPKQKVVDTGKEKRQKSDIDYLKEVYQLRKTNIEAEIEGQQRIMDDEEKNYEQRLEAANNYYFQKEKLLELERDEQIRLNDLEYKNQLETYQTAINEGKATSSNLQELEYKHILVRKRIDADYEKNKSSLAVESAKKLQGVLEKIQDQYAKNQLSKQQLDNMRQAGLILSNVGGETTTKQFADIENKMRDLQQAEEDGQIKSLEIDLRRIQAQKDRLKNAEGIIQDNEKYNELSDQELKLQQQILDVQNKQKQAVSELYAQMKASTNEYLNSFSTGFLSDAGLGSLSTMFDQITYQVVKTLDDGTKVIEDRVGSTFDKLYDQAGTAKEKFAVVFNTITSVAQEAFAFLQQNQQASFDAMYANLDREKELRLKYAGESEEGRAEIERQYEERRRDIRIKEAKAQKETAIFNAILNTAQGITAALAQANIPLSIIIGAIGAAQIALIAGRELPAYKEGTNYHKGGLALVGDGGRSEIIQTPSGDLYRTPATDTIVNMQRGSKVFKSDLDFIKNSGTLFGGVPHIELERGGLSAGELDGIMGRHLANSTSFNMVLDKRGVNGWASNAYKKTLSHNNRVSFRGRSIS